MTLVFLGWQPPERRATLWEAARDAAAEIAAPVLTPAGVVPVPARRPRLFALELRDEDDRAAALHAGVARALEAAGLHEPESRPFWPHVTLARVRRGARARSTLSAGEPPAPFAAGALTLFRSHLAPSGARYSVLERLGLRSGPDG